MSAITDSRQATLAAIRSREHPHCVVCGRAHPHGLHVDFEVLPDGSVAAEFPCEEPFEGYPGIIHGGVLSALADGAMLHCLFAQGRRAVTANLSVQFRHPVEVGVPATVRARLLEQTDALYTLSAEIVQAGQVKARATGRFWAR